ncbi:2-dehydropantoate 2-reductase [Photobacterium makurazakiensis]|uniref:ketopantoate reductase family protein n=1 Tax=Photobacterium makurazakiensis TaxID=2910234 RepID=UPI003D0ADC8A
MFELWNDNNSDTVEGCKDPHIIVVGAGAMGCYFGGILLQAGHQLTFIDVDQYTIEAINHQGLILETDAGQCTVLATAALAKNVQKPADLVVLFTKTLHTEAAMASIHHLLTPNTVILSLQNGLGNAEKIAKYHDKSRIAIGTTLVPADLQAPGHVVSHGPSSSRLMDVNTQSPDWVDALVTLLNKAGLNTERDLDIHSVVWSKVAFNAALNAISAVAGATPGQIGSIDYSVELARNIVHETCLVGQATGIVLDEAYIWKTVEMAMQSHPNHKPSMMQDIEHGRETEIEAINGAIVASGEQLGVATPVNQTLYQLVKLKEFIVKDTPA